MVLLAVQAVEQATAVCDSTVPTLFVLYTMKYFEVFDLYWMVDPQVHYSACKILQSTSLYLAVAH
jgi:hypothetical protein